MKNEIDIYCKREISFLWKDPFHSIDVTIEIPEISENQISVWGDWGPMYTVSVDVQRPLKIFYKWESCARNESYSLDMVSEFRLNSPMLAIEREKTPFYYEIEDPQKDVVFELYLDASGDFHRAKIFQNIGRSEFYTNERSVENYDSESSKEES